jgi:hypothetical protein
LVVVVVRVVGVMMSVVVVGAVGVLWMCARWVWPWAYAHAHAHAHAGVYAEVVAPLVVVLAVVGSGGVD